LRAVVHKNNRLKRLCVYFNLRFSENKQNILILLKAEISEFENEQNIIRFLHNRTSINILNILKSVLNSI